MNCPIPFQVSFLSCQMFANECWMYSDTVYDNQDYQFSEFPYDYMGGSPLQLKNQQLTWQQLVLTFFKCIFISLEKLQMT